MTTHLRLVQQQARDVRALERVRVARGGQAIDIANAVAFLASEEAGFMTGASLIVDGGITLGPRHSWDPEEPRLFAALEAMAAEMAAPSPRPARPARTSVPQSGPWGRDGTPPRKGPWS